MSETQELVLRLGMTSYGNKAINQFKNLLQRFLKKCPSDLVAGKN
ncbi:MAG TPA: hypothetical protein VJM47_09965 [Nitrosospira sp.]|nr:hypothetical protein [Nitrosospira sp.]